VNYYKRHIGDYMKDASHLSLLEHGVYMRLLDVYYTREASIPVDHAARLIGARSKDEKAAMAVVAAEFFRVVDGFYTQTRCDLEISVMQQKAETNREVGKRGGRPKKVTNPLDSGNPEITQMVSGNNPDETLATNHKPITNIHSVPDGTGSDAAKSPANMTKDELWSVGKSLLLQAGMPKAQCGTFVGKLCKDYGNDIVIDAVRTACAERPAAPAEYLKALCMRAKGERTSPNKQEALEQRGQNIVDDWANQGANHATV
jgi:uncharacterized protein YdaU (DUF1376 family)